MSLPKGAYEAPAHALGPDNVCDDPAITSAYSYMWLLYSTHTQSGRYRPAAVVLPGSTEDVQTIIHIANRYRFNYIPVGTNLLPPTIPVRPDTVVIDPKRMDRILALDEKNMFAVVEPYVTYAQLQAETMKRGLTITVAEAGAQVSVLANNLFQGMGGTGHKFGFNRGVLACDWMLPTGELLKIGSRGNPDAGWFWGDCAGLNLKGLLSWHSAELQNRFDEAVDVLKRARLGKEEGGQYLYQLPWYLIIGPPGAGKTTALVNSGLQFPLGADAKVRGVGGTRNCDWWFTDEAVLLDTAGRYTTQDSQAEVDRSAWLGFLTLLKKHRRRRPINGVLVAVSVSDLLQQTETEIAQHTLAIKQRIQELHRELGIRFPVYVLFTKCDLLAGFSRVLRRSEIDLLLNRRVPIGFFPWRFVDGEASIGRCVAFVEDEEYDKLMKRKAEMPVAKFGDAYDPAHVERLNRLSKLNLS